MANSTAEERAVVKLQQSQLSASELNGQLLMAATKKWAKVVEELLKMGADANALASGRSALAHACQFGTDDVATANVLLAARADPNGPAVMETCGVATLPILVAAGGKLNGEVTGINPLMSAIVTRTKEDKALALIEAGVDVNVRDMDHATPLMLAAERGRLKVVDALIKAGADLFAVDSTGRSLVRRVAETVVGGKLSAIETERKAARQILRKLRDQLPAQPEDVLLIQIVLGDAKELRQRIAAGLDPNIRIAGGVGQLGLHRADYIEMLAGHTSVDQMLKTGVLPSGKDLDRQIGGSPVLMWAVAARNAAIIKLLLDAGADPDLTNDAGLSSRALAKEWGDAATRAIFVA